MKPPEARTVGYAVSVIAAIGWGFAGVIATLASAPALVLSFYRLWIGVAILLIFVYASGRRLTWDVLRGSWSGGIFLAADMALFFSAIKQTSIVDVTVIGALQPVLVLLAARPLFGERTGRYDIAWMLVALAGVDTTVLGPGVKSSHEIYGYLLALGSTGSLVLVLTRVQARAS
jgi:drug/metabolite transporter (DMT)-like permease